MRIGAFVKKNHTTEDTIRHYMELGLLLAEKRNAQYFFDAQCQFDFDDIISLKNMGFSLHEIKHFFYYKRLGKLTDSQSQNYYTSLLYQKQQQLFLKKDQIKKQIVMLEDKIKESNDHSPAQNYQPSGIPIEALSLFHCPRCHKPLILKEANISDNQILSGVLICECGKAYRILQGILIDSDLDIESDIWSYDENYLDSYLSYTDASYLDNLSESIDWFHKKIDLNDYKQPVFLELGSGVGFFLRNIVSYLPKDSLYIALDHDINRQLFLKQCMDASQEQRNIIFVCADFLQIPLKEDSVDILCDISGTSNYNFTHTDFLLNHLIPFVKKEHLLIGSYILFQNFSLQSKIPKEFQKNFTKEELMKNLDALSYKQVESKVSDLIRRGGIYEDYFTSAEAIFSYLILAKPWA